ncbi:MAG: type II toxin-antitoxin system Phd/YefM family antitoxin [Planctomycetes bacterium]|nr:type II toxin-antitoxin system Phd/YefM family antitoxin [Planctomycetota bacterium]
MTNAKTITVREARAHFSELIEQVAFGGDRLIITFHGRPRAAIVSLEDLAQIDKGAEPEKKRQARRRA